LPTNYIDDTDQLTKYAIIASTLDKICKLEITNFTIDIETTMDIVSVKGRIWAHDKHNFGIVAYDSEQNIISGNVYTKEDNKFYVYTLNETTKVWTKAQSETENTLLTIEGGILSQASYDSLLQS
jgi:ADP-glucose pyrophosphorylase